MALVAVAWGLWSSSEAWRLQWRSESLEEQLGARAREIDYGAERESELREQIAADERRIAFLGAELDAAMRREQAVNEALAAQVEEVARLRDQLEGRRRQLARPMPEGVRLILEALGELLVVDGYDGLRFVHAASSEEQEIRAVELLERDLDGWTSTFHRAGRMRIELQRSSNSLALVLFEGSALRAGTVTEYPEEGYRIELPEVDGPMWEDRVGFLLVAQGEYPAPEEVAAARPRGVDPTTLAAWVERIDGMLMAADTDIHWRLERFRTLEQARFGEALLLGFDDGGVLLRSAEADRLSIEVDRVAGTVNLLLEGGTLHQQAGDTKIPPSGYRVLLAGVTPAEAIQTMLGLVVKPRD